jgi:hypothetical protein
MSLYDGNDELELERLNAGPSFEENQKDDDDIYDYYEDNLTDEERKDIESLWLDQFSSADGSRENERERLEYCKKNHIDPETGYPYVEGRKPHHWVEQEDGSWSCILCGDKKIKKDRKKDYGKLAPGEYEEQACQRTLEWMRSRGKEIPVRPLSAPGQAVEDVWSKINSNKNVEISSDNLNKISVEALIDDKIGDADEKMTNMEKFKLDKSRNIRAKKYFQKQSCSLCSEDSEYNLAKYENWNGEKLCRSHLEELLKKDLDEDGKDNGVNYLHDVEKITYGRVASIDSSRTIRDPLMLNDMDRLFLQKRGREDMYTKIMKGTKLCDSDQNLDPDQRGPCKEKAMYYAVYKNGIAKFLCKDHMEESFWKDEKEIRDVFKVYIKQWEDHELPEEKQSSRDIAVVNVDMDQMDDEGSILISTGEIAREMVHNRVMSSDEVPFLYRCSTDIAMCQGKGRYKIEDPKMIAERVLGARSGADSRSGVSIRHIASVKTNEESSGSHYFNLPRVNKSKSKQIASYQEAEKLGVFYDYHIVNDEIAKKVFLRFCKGEISPRQLDKTVTGGSTGDSEDFEFWDDIFPFSSEDGEWRHSRRSRRRK